MIGRRSEDPAPGDAADRDDAASGSDTLPEPGVLPEPGTLDVWILDLAAPWCDALADTGVAVEVERARAGRMAGAGLGRRLLARRSAMRFLLGRYLDRDPGSVDVVTAPGGKPVLLPESGKRTLAFSVGHSGDLYGVAVGSSRSVGFDVERRRAVPRAGAIARRWFRGAEADELLRLEGEELEREFMRLWTAKEALAKRHGAGLRLMMRGDVEELDTEAAAATRRLRWLSPRPGYHGAVASSDPIERVTLIAPEDDAWLGPAGRTGG